MSKRRRDDEDLGFRTPTRSLKKKTSETGRRKRETGKHKRDTGRRKRETGKHDVEKKRETGKHERETGKHQSSRRKRESSKHKRETGKHKRETGKHPAKKAEPAASNPAIDTLPEERSSPLPLIAGVATAVILIGLVTAVMLNDEPRAVAKLPTPAPEDTEIVPEETKTLGAPAPETPVQPRNTRSGLTTRTAIEVNQPIRVKPVPRKAPESGDALKELAKKSATHAEVARLLEELDRLLDPNRLRNPGPNFVDFQKRRKMEQELIERIRAMGPLAVDALKDIILGVDNRQYRIFLGKALAGIEGPEARQAISDILGQIKDIAVQTTVVRNLPRNADVNDTLAGAFRDETNSTLRAMLLREYSRRLPRNAETDLFRKAAKDPDINVRAEAITIIGRRGNPENQRLMEEIIRDEKSLMLRQRAIVSYAQTSKSGDSGSLGFLEDLARNDQNLAIRASAILGISRIGGDRAINSLEQIAMTDSSQAIRDRANRMATQLRRNRERANDPAHANDPKNHPLKVDPGAIPIEKR